MATETPEPTSDASAAYQKMRKRSEATKPNITPAQKAYLQGWRHGSKDDIKKGPANQKDEKLRAVYLQGFDHGLNDFEMAEQHAKSTYG